MKKLLSGNEALALGAYHAGVTFATAYPGTPSTEIMEAIAQFKDIYAEWSTNEKVAVEVAMGACYIGARTLVSMKQVGLNVAADPFLAVATTGVKGGFVLIEADDPGIHSSQGEQDNRHYAELAKVPVLEPTDSQSAYDLMPYAFEISEQFDTPVILRSTTRISHSKSIVDVKEKPTAPEKKLAFSPNMQKWVMLPINARTKHTLMEERMVKLAEYGETFPFNKIESGDRQLGIIATGISYQYAREIFPKATFLKLGMTYPLPEKLIRAFAAQVDRILVVEELDPFIENQLKAMELKVDGKNYIPRTGELNSDIIAAAGRKMGLIKTTAPDKLDCNVAMAKRPPLLCPGCPHTGFYYVLAGIGQRLKLPGSKDKTVKESNLVIAGDIGCYTLGAYPPLNAMDTNGCMGSSIGTAIGMEKAGISGKVVAVIGDSTFLHSGVTPLIDAVYNQSKITVIITDNSTTAMTGHQEHPGTGVSVQGGTVGKVIIEDVVKGVGVKNVAVVSSFNIKEIRAAIKSAMESSELSVVIVRGACVVNVPKHGVTQIIDTGKCNQCGMCLLVGCPAIQTKGKQPAIDAGMCTGCTICTQVCPRQAIGPVSAGKEALK
jgi:indolepyruvate ferredoxin oxidoreductase alpha subunit